MKKKKINASISNSKLTLFVSSFCRQNLLGLGYKYINLLILFRIVKGKAATPLFKFYTNQIRLRQPTLSRCR